VGAALILVLVGFSALAAGVLIGRYYVPDDRQLRRTARHGKAYMRALGHLIARDHETVVSELRTVVEENVDDVEPYFALGAMFRSRGEHERAIRVHQALALRERDRKKLRLRAMYELGLDFRAAGMPRRATKAMEEVLLAEPGHEGSLRALAALYEEQARFNEAAGLWQRLGRRRNEDTSQREHHLLVAAAQAALARDDLDSAKQLLKAGQRHRESAHFFAVAAELATARGNHRGTRERLRQALIADPALAPHLLPGLIAVEQALAEGAPGTPDKPDELADDDEVAPPAAPVESTALVVPDTVALVPSDKPVGSVADRVLALLADVETQTGPRLEIALIRAQLAPSDATVAQLASDLATRFPDALAARVATGRLALAGGDPSAIKTALEVFVSDRGALAWALRGRWQCQICGAHPGAFSWRCSQCRRWGSLKMETGIEPPPIAPRERRAAPRVKPDGLLGVSPDAGLPTPTLDPGLSEEDLAAAGTRRSLLGKMGGWLSRSWRRGAR
jgi:lipopolysaccharide biosynthesis regulator YciM